MKLLRRSTPLFIAAAVVPAVEAQTPCVNGMAGTYPCSNVDLLAQLTPSQLGSTTSVADLWGWTDPLTLKEYAVVGCRTGTSFVDLSTPTAPVVVGFLPTHVQPGGSLWRDVDVAGTWCYVGSEISGHGLQVFDLTRLRNVTSPPVTFTEDAWYGGFGNSHTIYADKQHPYVYAVGATSLNNGGLTVVNVTNPLVPILAGTFTSEGYIHENMVITYAGPDADHAGEQVSFNFHTGNDRITVVNVTDKTDMETISTITYTGGNLCHQGWVTEDHRYLLMDDEGDEPAFGHTTRTRMFNIEDLDAPYFLGYFSGPNASVDHNLYVHKQLVYESNYTSGLHILDATNVATGSLAMSAWIDTYTANNGTSYNGAWGNYPFFASGIVLVSSVGEGLFVLRPRLSVRLKAMLEGPFDQVSGLMRDDLRTAGLVPLTEPYTGIGYAHVNGGGGETTTAGVLATTGPDAIVDWVAVELRDASSPATILATHAALLQRDGDIVGMDGTSPVQFTLPVGDYHVAVRHRNHLGVMTAAPVRVSIAQKSYDLSDGSVPLFGTEPTKPIGAVDLLWAGNAERDAQLKYTGSFNDRDQVLLAIGGSVPTMTLNGYHTEDCTMDGEVKYTGIGNDRDPILVNIGGSVPSNTRAEQLP